MFNLIFNDAKINGRNFRLKLTKLNYVQKTIILQFLGNNSEVTKIPQYPMDVRSHPCP